VEISFEGKSLKYYKRVFDASLSKEETMEIIVPDTMPDAAAVIDSDGLVLLKSKEAAGGRIIITGVSEVCVIYRPEDGSGLRKMNIQLPFNVSGDCPEMTNMGRICASCRLVSVEARIINSRKILVKTDVCVTVTAYVQQLLSYCSGITPYKGGGLQLLEKKMSLNTVADVTEKTFSIREDFTLPSSKPPMGTVLKSRLRLTLEEAGNLGSKLIIKGSACIMLVYVSSSDGDINCAEFKTPYSAIMELDWDDANMSFNTLVMPTGYSLTENSSGGISLEIGVVAQAAVWRRTELTYITDAYSTEFETELKTEAANIELLSEKSQQNDTLKLMCETPKPIKTIIDASAGFGRLYTENNNVKMAVNSKLLCIAEDGTVFTAGARSEAVKEIDQKAFSAIKTSAELGELFASPTANGAEIRIPVTYILSSYTNTVMNLAFSALVDEESPRAKADAPSVIVFRAAPSDSLWEVAKRYGTTRDYIKKANGMEEEAEIATGDLILVAKQR
jgi:hypothetical protein